MKIIVVGGGAAGMMAAIAAAEDGAEVILIEQNEKLGKKIYITGKGRCNVTNNCNRDELMNNIVRNPRFLYSAFDIFDNSDIQEMLTSNGCELKVERGERVFPVSDHASDIIFTLMDILKKNNVKVLLNVRVKELLIEDNVCMGVITENGDKKFADAVILATGGNSYKTTGSDGKMLELLKEYGHDIKTLRPALVPFNCNDEWIRELQGLSLKNVEFRLDDGKKTRYKGFGEMLFTHFGISGPIVLSGSSYYEPGYKGYIDLKPALTEKQLDERLLREFAANSNKNFDNALDDLFPKKMIPVMIGLSGMNPYKKVHQITGEERIRFGKLIKNLPVDIAGTRGFDEAIITRGGINVKEVVPSTMQSKVISGLSFAGEMLDIDALTGGFNLQVAWSTGYLAGKKAFY